MKKEFTLLIICITAIFITANNLYADEPQQSKTGPAPSLQVLIQDAEIEFIEQGSPPVSPVVIPGVPNYLWRHGCGPTAVGHVVGYYDGQGYGDLITGNASTQTNDVNQAIASGGDSTNPNPAGSEQHYEDYSCPEDSYPTLLTDDYITKGRTAHTDDCIGDYQDTSKSTRSNYYGWSWSNDIGPSFVNYVNLRNTSYNPSYTEYQWSTGTLTWAVLTNEINNNRPMVFLVDSDGDGSTDHFVAVVGYDVQTNQYGCHDSWDNTKIRWETFQGMGSQPWGIWGGWSFNLGTSGPVTKWEQPPDTTSYGVDVRCDRRDGMQRVLADDFECTQTGPITKVRLWGSWKNDIKGNIQTIHLSIHSDDPVGPGGSDPQNTYSKPDYLLWSRDFNPTEFTEALFMDITPEYEWWWDPVHGLVIQNGDQKIWQYDITIDPNQAFVQEGELGNPIVYWLDAYVIIAPDSPEGANFGWKTSIDHWNDDAVWSSDDGVTWNEMRYPPQHPYAYDSADLAFAIITGQQEEPNEPDVKWLQRPDLSENGLDVFASDPLILADDFLCTETNLITDITVWASWKNDILPPGGPGDVTFTLSIHSDIPDPDPCNPQDWSMPGDVLWFMDVVPTAVSIEKDQILEGWWDPQDPLSYIFPGDTICWKYTFHIDPNDAFCQMGEPNNPIVYWLDVQAHPNDVVGGAQFGWKSSIDHWNDDAVWGNGVEPYLGPWQELVYPFGHEMEGISIDLAFAIDGNIPCEPNEPEDPNLKYLQRPDTSENGIDIRFDRRDGIQRTLADDFPCTSKGRITDVHLWCSWLNDIKGNVEMIHLSIHDDIPASASLTGYSMPGNLLWQRDVTPAEFNETLFYTLPYGYEWWWDPYIPIVNPMGDTQIWKYDIYIPWDDAFEQEGEPNNPKVYWLDAWVMLTPDSPPEAEMGWKTSIDHWNDAAVYDLGGGNWINLLYPINHPLGETNVDLAFAITTRPDCLFVGKVFNVACNPAVNLTVTAAMYNNWVTLGKPAVWCCDAQKCGNVANNITNQRVDVADVALVKGSWLKSVGQAGYSAAADTNISGRVDVADIGVIKAHWLKNVGFCLKTY